MSYKWTSPGITGVPDRIIIVPNGLTIYAEIKDTHGTLSARQKYIAKQLIELNCYVFVVRSEEDIDSIISRFFTA